MILDYLNLLPTSDNVDVQETLQLIREALDRRRAKKALWRKRRYNNLSLSRKVRQMQVDRVINQMREESQPKKIVLLNLD